LGWSHRRGGKGGGAGANVGVAAWRPARWRVAPAVAAAVGCLAGGGHGVCGRRQRAIGAAVARRRRRCGLEMQTRRSWRPRGQRTGHVRRVLDVHLLIAPSTAAAPAFSWCLMFASLLCCGRTAACPCRLSSFDLAVSVYRRTCAGCERSVTAASNVQYSCRMHRSGHGRSEGVSASWGCGGCGVSPHPTFFSLVPAAPMVALLEHIAAHPLPQHNTTVDAASRTRY